MNQLTPERRLKLGKALGWGLGAAVLVAPVAFLAVQGIVGVAIAAVLGLACVHLAPWAGMKLANLGLKAQKAEARSNPIETMQMQAVEARRRLAAARQELVSFSAEVRNFESEVRALKSGDHPEDAADFEEQLQAMKKLQAHKQSSINQADAEAGAFEQSIKRAQAKWKVAQSALRISRLAGDQQDDAMREILKAESLDSVQSAMNRALAEMDSAIAQQTDVLVVIPAGIAPSSGMGTPTLIQQAPK